MADDLTHLRITYQNGADRWDVYRTIGGRSRGPFQQSRGVCDAMCWTADTYARPGRGHITCPTCAVFGDAWLRLGMKGALTVRRVRAFARDLASGAARPGEA